MTNAEFAVFQATLDARPTRNARGKLARADVQGADAELLFTTSGGRRHAIELDDTDVRIVRLNITDTWSAVQAAGHSPAEVVEMLMSRAVSLP